MASADHLRRLRQGADGWNAWRAAKPSVLPDLSGAKLGGAKLSGMNFIEADLTGADLTGANLQRVNAQGINLRGAKLYQADLSEAYLHWADIQEADLGYASFVRADIGGADLEGSNLQEANLYAADLQGADLVRADFSRANLNQANLKLANLVESRFDYANLTGVKFWESQRSGWSIKSVICQNAFWDKASKELIKYEEGEFERIFAEKPRIVLRYSGGMSQIDLFALPIVVERLQAEHPGSVLQVRSVQNDAGGATATITIEDVDNREPEAFGQELVRIQAKLECIVDERDRLQQRLDSIVSAGISKIAEFLALPRQEIHVHRPTGLTAIEGPTMSRDTYNIPGQAGAVGPGASAQGNTFQQVQGGIDLAKLADELRRLHGAMKAESGGTREQDKAVVAVADAEEAAAKGDGPAALHYLKSAGKWTLGIAEKIGVAVAIEALKKAM